MSKSSYAHLLQSATAAPSAKSVKAKEVDPNESERMDSPPANDKEDGKKAKRKAKAAEDEGDEEEKEQDEESEEGEDDQEKEDRKEKKNKERDDKEDKKSKKAAAEGDHIRAAALAERLRCARIFRSSAAAGRPNLAAQFAFHTELDADSAIAIMETTVSENQSAAPTTRRVSIDERMSYVRDANVGADADVGAGQTQTLSEKQLAAMPSDKRALMIVNAGRVLRGEQPMQNLPQ